MEIITENLGNILLVLGAVYPPLMYLLPVKYASKIDLGIKILKAVSSTLENAKNSKGGLSSEIDEALTENKTFVQKSKK
jgi:hypothetical protein